MATAQVFRPQRDWKGQTAGELDDYLIATGTGVVMGGHRFSLSPAFPAL
jgi:hypothetical protein